MTAAAPRRMLLPGPLAWAWLASAALHALLAALAARAPATAPDRSFEPIRIVMVEPPPSPAGLPGEKAEPGVVAARAARPKPVPPARTVRREIPKPPAKPIGQASPARPEAAGTPALTALVTAPPPPAGAPRPAVAAGRPDTSGGGLPGGMAGGRGDVPIPAGRAARPPQILRQVAPEYPLGARSGGLEGEVVIEAIVDRRGEVEEPLDVLRSVPGLDEAALAAVRRWRFRPAQDEDGRPVRVIVEIPIRFVLR